MHFEHWAFLFGLTTGVAEPDGTLLLICLPFALLLPVCVGAILRMCRKAKLEDGLLLTMEITVGDELLVNVCVVPSAILALAKHCTTLLAATYTVLRVKCPSGR